MAAKLSNDKVLCFRSASASILCDIYGDYSEEHELNLELTIEGDVGNIYTFKMGESCGSE
jgi:hypothetical protein